MASRPVLTCMGLCAGVGGLELGIRLGEHLREYDVRGVCYVEREAAGAASLVASMDAGWLHPAPVWSDLATFDGRPWRGRVHILASGDPCQGNSVAGKKLGAEDERFLIPQVLRIVDEVRPDRLVRENVTGNAAGQLDALAGPLESMGYVVAAGIFSSGRTGNSHGRERLVVVADRAGGAWWLHAGPRRPDEGTTDAGGCGERLDDAELLRLHARRIDHVRHDGHELGAAGQHAVAVGDASSSRSLPSAQRGICREQEGGRPRHAEPKRRGGALADADDCGLRTRSGSRAGGSSRRFDAADRGRIEMADASVWEQRRARQSGTGGRSVEFPTGGHSVRFPPAVLPGPSDSNWRDILDHWPQLAPALDEAEAQSLLRGGFDAVAHRIERLRACGNGVDPVVGAYAVLRLGALLADERRKRAAGVAAVRAA